MGVEPDHPQRAALGAEPGHRAEAAVAIAGQPQWKVRVVLGRTHAPRQRAVSLDYAHDLGIVRVRRLDRLDQAVSRRSPSSTA